MKGRVVWKLMVQTFNEWFEDDVSKFAASLAFYTMFSLVPTLLIVLAIVGGFYGPDAARSGIMERSEWLIGMRGVQIVSSALDEARRSPGTTTAAGFVGFLFGATAVFVNLQDALNTIWKVAPKPGWQ